MRQGLLSFMDFVREPGTIVRLRTDTSVAIEVINGGSSRSPALMDEFRRVHAVCIHPGVPIRAEYIPSALKLSADRLSRTRDSTVWPLSRPAFLDLDRRYGPLTIDLFATAENACCGGLFYKFPSPGGTGVDDMSVDWRGDNAWANPPFNLVGLVIDKIVREGASVTLVAPRWEAQP